MALGGNQGGASSAAPIRGCGSTAPRCAWGPLPQARTTRRHYPGRPSIPPGYTPSSYPLKQWAALPPVRTITANYHRLFPGLVHLLQPARFFASRCLLFCFVSLFSCFTMLQPSAVYPRRLLSLSMLMCNKNSLNSLYSSVLGMMFLSCPSIPSATASGHVRPIRRHVRAGPRPTVVVQGACRPRCVARGYWARTHTVGRPVFKG